MANSSLVLVAVAAVGWLIADASSLQKPGTPPSRTVVAPSATSTAVASRSTLLEARHDPVPLVRRRPAPVVQEVPPPSTPRTVADAPEGFDRKAAQAAVEADGYKRVNILGKDGNGTWRATGYRGTTEVALAVDSRGRVSMR